MVGSVQHGDCQALVDAFIDGATSTDGEAVERCWGSADELAATAYSHAARLLLVEMATGLDDGPGPWLVRWERAVRAVVTADAQTPGAGAHHAQRAGRGLGRDPRAQDASTGASASTCSTSEYVRDRDPDHVPDLHVELIAGAVYRAYVAEAVAGRLTDPRADVVPRLVTSSRFWSRCRREQPLARPARLRFRSPRPHERDQHDLEQLRAQASAAACASPRLTCGRRSRRSRRPRPRQPAAGCAASHRPPAGSGRRTSAAPARGAPARPGPAASTCTMQTCASAG